MSVITSRQHPIVKEFRELAHGGGPSMLLDGWHLLAEAVGAGAAIETVAVCGPPTAAEQITIDRARRAGAQVIEVSGGVLNTLSPVNAPTGVVASAKKPRVEIGSVLHPAPALILAGIGVQDPGNTGALVRSAAAAGSTGVVLDETTADPWGWKALRASMGSVFRVPVIRTRAVAQAVDAWRAAGVSVVAAVPRGGTPMYDVDFTKPTAVLLGGEGAGLSAALLKAADSRVSIPMNGATESLNVAVAAALLLYEARRQRLVRQSHLAP
jgi:TrmH family RNA methyltransferase